MSEVIKYCQCGEKMWCERTFGFGFMCPKCDHPQPKENILKEFLMFFFVLFIGFIPWLVGVDKIITTFFNFFPLP